MAGETLDQLVQAGIALLPAAGTEVVFDTYKAQLLAAYPNNGKDAFTYMLKGKLINTKLRRDKDGNMVVMLSRIP